VRPPLLRRLTSQRRRPAARPREAPRPWASNTPSANEPSSLAAMSLVVAAAEASTARAREEAPIKEASKGTREAASTVEISTGGVLVQKRWSQAQVATDAATLLLNGCAGVDG